MNRTIGCLDIHPCCSVSSSATPMYCHRHAPGRDRHGYDRSNFAITYGAQRPALHNCGEDDNRLQLRQRLAKAFSDPDAERNEGGPRESFRFIRTPAIRVETFGIGVDRGIMMHPIDRGEHHAAFRNPMSSQIDIMSGPVWKFPDRREHPERLCNDALGVRKLDDVLVSQSTSRKDLIDFLLQSFLRFGEASE